MAARALRAVLTFALAFSATFGAQIAFAAGRSAEEGGAFSAMQEEKAGEGGAEEPGGQPADDPPPASEPGEPDEPAPLPSSRITDLGIYVKPAGTERIDVLAYATAGIPASPLEITQKGGFVDLDAASFWNDGSVEYDWGHVRWSVESGDEVATIARDTGLLTATGTASGEVVVAASLDPDYAADADAGASPARILVRVSGQVEVPYVSEIVICDDAGEPIEPSYTFHDVGLSVALIELQARVTVRDPRAPEGLGDMVYQVTPGNGLARQTGGAIADLQWLSAEGSFGAMSDDGVYRPLREATNIVYARSSAGLDGAVVSASAVIIMPGEGEAHPQDSLTVDVTWEAYPDEVVAARTFSVADMEALGTHLVTYTAFGGGLYGFMTFTGRGPYLSDVLAAAGVDASGVARLRIESFDNPYVVSWDLLVGKDRYYFPNMDIGSQADAVQVAPMIAIDSKRAPLGTSDPVPVGELTSDDRFRLLFGSGIGDEGFTTTSMQRYWIHTIHVVLSGAPPAQVEDEPEPEPESEEPRREELASIGLGGGAGAEARPVAAGASGAASDESGERSQREGNAGAWSVLQAVNRNDSAVDGLDFDNPLGPFAGALGAGMLAAGGAEAFIRFRWEKRVPRAWRASGKP